MDAALEKRQVKRAYKLYAPAYDLVFDWIFHPGREAAIQLLGIEQRAQSYLWPSPLTPGNRDAVVHTTHEPVVEVAHLCEKFVS